MHWTAINKLLGNIDLYWLDFILKGHLADDDRLLDVGCGEGRNISYCMKQGYDIFGVDINPDAISFVKMLALQHKLDDAEGRFQVMDLKNLRFPDSSFNVVLSSAVFHFAEDETQFFRMFSECVRVLKPGGKFFIRTATDLRLLSENSKINADLNLSEQPSFLLKDTIMTELAKTFALELLEPTKYVTEENRKTIGNFILQKPK